MTHKVYLVSNLQISASLVLPLCRDSLARIQATLAIVHQRYNEYADMYMLGRTMMEVYHQPSNWRNLAERLLSQNPAERVTASFVREVAEQNLGYIGGNAV
jgi:hypothetical protein